MRPGATLVAIVVGTLLLPDPALFAGEPPQPTGERLRAPSLSVEPLHIVSDTGAITDSWTALSGSRKQSVIVTRRADSSIAGELARIDETAIIVLEHDRPQRIERTQVCDVTTTPSRAARKGKYIGLLAAAGAGAGLFVWTARELGDVPTNLGASMVVGAAVGVAIGVAADALVGAPKSERLYTASDRTGCR